ncbi:MAG TPA: hypothetical protein VK786_05755, partial [bacterium]|nr:hypothetical protein [bacterium]
AREGALEAMEDRDRGFEILNPAPGAPGWVRFHAGPGRPPKRRRLAWDFTDAAGRAWTRAAPATIQIRESARRSGDFVALTRLKEKRLGDWHKVRTLEAETSVFDRNGLLRFRFQGRGRLEAATNGRAFVWLPERGDGADFAVQGPVFFGPDGGLISDHRAMGQCIGNLASQLAFSPDGRTVAVQLSLPAPRLAVFRDGEPAYQVPGIFSKAILSDQGGLACVEYSKLVFYKNGVERAEAKLFVEAGLAQGEELYCLSQAELENDSNDKEIDLIRFTMDGTKREDILALRGIKALDPGLEREFRILRPANDIFIYRLKKRPKPVFNPRYSAPNPAQ